MGRKLRQTPKGFAYHTYNRVGWRHEIFSDSLDYICFLKCLSKAKEEIPINVCSVCIMPNHWHLALYPKEDELIQKFMHRLTSLHVKKWQKRWNCIGTGPLYQGRYKLKIVKDISYYLNLIRYIERNPVRANLVSNCTDWPWSSATIREQKNNIFYYLIDQGPIKLPDNWNKFLEINQKIQF